MIRPKVGDRVAYLPPLGPARIVDVTAVHTNGWFDGRIVVPNPPDQVGDTVWGWDYQIIAGPDDVDGVLRALG